MLVLTLSPDRLPAFLPRGADGGPVWRPVTPATADSVAGDLDAARATIADDGFLALTLADDAMVTQLMGWLRRTGAAPLAVTASVPPVCLLSPTRDTPAMRLVRARLLHHLEDVVDLADDLLATLRLPDADGPPTIRFGPAPG